MNQIKYLVDKKGLKQKDIALVTGISEPRVSKLKTYSDSEYLNKVYASEHNTLKRIVNAQE